MDAVRFNALVNAAAVARRQHRKHSHIDREMTWLRCEQLREEMISETRAFWPMPIISVCAALAAGSIAILFFAGVI